MRIRFIGDPTQTIRSMNEFAKELLIEGGFTRSIREAHQIAQDQVIARLLAHPRSFFSNPSEFPIRAAIARNITHVAFRRGADIIGGTGDTRILDQLDPVHNLSRPVRLTAANPEQRLWRILEMGTKKKNYPISASFKPVLRFIWRRTGAFVVSKQITHPGQEGFRYFAEVAHFFGILYDTIVRAELNRIVYKHSGR